MQHFIQMIYIHAIRLNYGATATATATAAAATAAAHTQLDMHGINVHERDGAKCRELMLVRRKESERVSVYAHESNNVCNTCIKCVCT